MTDDVLREPATGQLDLRASGVGSQLLTEGPQLGVTDDALPPPPARGEVWRYFSRNRLAVVGLAFIVLLVVAAIAAPVITNYSYDEINPLDRNLPPFSGDHWFGTDNLGRDLFSQVVYGARVSLRVGIIVSLASSVLGVLIGAVAGYFGGILDNIAMRLIDMFLSIPYIILTVVLIGLIGRGLNAVIIALSLTGWFIVARVVRASFLQLKEQEFVQAARALGFPRWRIMFRHILPNALQPVIVYTALGVGAAILSEAALSFLGIGVLPPTPAWGLLVATNRSFVANQPWLVFFPGGAISLTVLSFLLVGDGLRDALDPKVRS